MNDEAQRMPAQDGEMVSCWRMSIPREDFLLGGRDMYGNCEGIFGKELECIKKGGEEFLDLFQAVKMAR